MLRKPAYAIVAFGVALAGFGISRLLADVGMIFVIAASTGWMVYSVSHVRKHVPNSRD